ncbi:pre-mRNA-splicing factor cwc22 [Phlyctochytrium planicorne]|nr:pre-mRNA-splicing factor cwc22 [Phlyctochytrium planicorne]
MSIHFSDQQQDNLHFSSYSYPDNSSSSGYGQKAQGGYQAPGYAAPSYDQGQPSISWSAAFGTGGFADEPPLLEELGVNFSHILTKALAVLNPLKPLDKNIMDDTDLAGPLIFCFLFGGFLLFSGKVHFGYIYGIAMLGWFSMYAILNLMNEQGVDGYRTASVLGYCLLPMVLLSFLSSILVPLRGGKVTHQYMTAKRGHEDEVEGSTQAQRRRLDEDDGDDIGPMPPPPAKAEPPPRPKSFAERMSGAYIPPAKLRALQAAIADKESSDYQRMTWEALKKSINGLINKVNVSNIKMIIPELFSENLIRGRGLFCRSLMKAQAASIPFTHVYAAMVSIINTKFPQLGELLLVRLIAQYRRAYKRNDKTVCLAVTKFIGHLVNQKVAHEIVALQIVTLLLERPTDDSVEVAVGFMREVGAFLGEMAPRASNATFERFRSILHEGAIDKRTQYMVEVLFQVRKEKFKDNPPVMPELELVEDEDQVTHYRHLDEEELDTEEMLNVFKFDPNYKENEAKYEAIKKEILGESDEEDDADDEDDEDGEEDDEDGEEIKNSAQQQMKIIDATNTNLINLRRAIYLTIMSSLNFEECAHKLMKLGVQEGQEIELCNMIIECCSQERTYVSFYGLLGERFCRLSLVWAEAFGQTFEETYKTIHRYETNRLRNVSKYFAHLLASDALSWNVFTLVRLTEQDTTSASRIFIKILFEELNGAMGLKRLHDRLNDENMVVSVETESGTVSRGVFDGLFPKDNPRNTRFAINYFTSIGLGGLTTELREYLKNAPKMIMAQKQEVESSDSDSDSDSDSSDSSDSSSDSVDSSSSSSNSDSSDSSSSSKSSK